MSLLNTSGAAMTALLLSSVAAAQAPTFSGPTPYTSVANSMFFATERVGVDYYLEDFEKGVITAPGLSVSDPNVLIKAPSPSTDSVDLDDRALDGSGAAGRSLANGVTGVINVQFDSGILGGFPTQVGFVWTDGGTGTAATITVIGGLGSIGFTTISPLGDGNGNGGTSEDRFIGIEFDEGIAQIQIADSSGVIEVDHIQYSAPVAGTQFVRNRVDAGPNSDLIWHKPASGNVACWLLNGLVKRGGPASQVAPTTFVSQGLGDLDADGDADIVWRDSVSNLVYVWLMNGQTVALSSAVQVAGAVGANFVCLAIVDTNGDKKADVVFRNTTNNQLSIWYMDGATRLSGGAVTDLNNVAVSSAGLVYTSAGDFNGDGCYDLIWRDATTNVVSGWLLNGRKVFQNGAVGNAGAVGSTWVAGAVGDLDGDGRSDIAWRNTSSGASNGWLMNGLYRKQGGSIGNIPVAWTLRTAADINGNGKDDLIWTNTSTGQVNAWVMDGLTKLSGGTIAPLTLTDWSLVNR